jgi:hypothetical protein
MYCTFIHTFITIQRGTSSGGGGYYRLIVPYFFTMYIYIRKGNKNIEPQPHIYNYELILANRHLPQSQNNSVKYCVLRICL